MLGLTILLSEAIELLRNSNGPVTPLIRRCISWCREFRDHKEQTQSIHQAVIRAFRYTDGVKIGYPAHLRKGMGKDNPGNSWEHLYSEKSSPPWVSPGMTQLKSIGYHKI